MGSLYELMQKANTKGELLGLLEPETRVVCVEQKIESSNQLKEAIQTMLSLVANAIEHHEKPVNIQFSRKPRSGHVTLVQTGGFSHSEIAAVASTQAPKNKAAVLLGLLSTIESNITTGTVSTIRDVYYSNTELYSKQSVVVFWLAILQKTFNLNSRDSLNIIPAQKGLFFSPVTVTIANTGNSQQALPSNKSSLIPYINEKSQLSIEGTVSNIIVIEKEAIYNRLITSVNNTLLQNAIIITGKGYPDFLTRLFLHKLQNVPELAYTQWKLYTDADPYGVNIALKYVENELEMYTCRKLKYKGVFLTALLNSRFAGNSAQLLPLSARDVTLAIQNLKLTTNNHQEHCNFTRQLQRQIFFYKKGEMNALDIKAIFK